MLIKGDKKMKTKNSTWKVVLITIAIIIAVALMAVFGVQSYMNRAISMEEQVSTAKSDVNVQKKDEWIYLEIWLIA